MHVLVSYCEFLESQDRGGDRRGIRKLQFNQSLSVEVALSCIDFRCYHFDIWYDELPSLAPFSVRYAAYPVLGACCSKWSLRVISWPLI